MATYQVTLCFDATIDIDIQAKDEKDAIEKARNQFKSYTKADFTDYERAPDQDYAELMPEEV